MADEPIEEGKEEAIPSDNGVETPEVQEEIPETQEPVEPPKPGSIEYTKAVEERIGEVTGARHRAEAERDLYKQRLEQIELQPVQPSTTPEVLAPDFAEVEPVETSYDDYNQYIKDLASWQFRKEQATHTANATQQDLVNKAVKMEQNFNTKVSESKIVDDHSDFYDKMRLVNLVPGIRESVLTSDKAPELALHLANNPEVMYELNNLDPLVAARKLGAIEAKLSGKVEKKIATTAPEPLTPVNTDTSAITEDSPKDIKDWMKKRNERQKAKIIQNVEGGKA